MDDYEKKNWSDQKPRKYGSMTQEEYVEERLNQFRAWYDVKASKAKKTYLWMRTTTVAGGATVPVLVNLKVENFDIYIDVITTLVSLLVIVFVSLESVFHFREQWKNYRATEQLLAKEYFNYVTAEGYYRGKEEKGAFLDFVDRVENAIASENASTLNVMTTVSEQKAQGSTQPVNVSNKPNES
ncbi:MAG: hypothetical protein ACJAS9_000979 [Polaribacter sp.]|jgi:hypothetical protein